MSVARAPNTEEESVPQGLLMCTEPTTNPFAASEPSYTVHCRIAPVTTHTSTSHACFPPSAAMMPLVVDVDEETLHDMQLCAGFSPTGSSVCVSASASRVLRTVVNVMRLSGMGTGSVMQRGEVSSLTSGATPNVITGFTL